MGQTIQQDEVAELVKRLPTKLRINVRADVLQQALQEGLLTVADDGRWVWQLPSKTLLAYFCGRMWCGDMPLYSQRAQGYIWQEGQGRFPRKDLVALFGVNTLRLLRKQRFWALLPKGWEQVDKIFDPHEKNQKSGI